VRRDPEEARALILAAAEKLFAARGPDAVGLKDVAREAGVSHALVSHYFGTFGALVEAALERRAAAVRAEVFERLLRAGDDLRPAELLDTLWEAAKDPVRLRLGAWALLSGRADSAQFFPKRVQGMRLVVEALEKRARAKRVTKEELEFIVTLGVAFTYGYALLRKPIRASLGHAASDEADADVRARFVELVEMYLARKR
jgi:AcrR family transcriptional regulator